MNARLFGSCVLGLAFLRSPLIQGYGQQSTNAPDNSAAPAITAPASDADTNAAPVAVPPDAAEPAPAAAPDPGPPASPPASAAAKPLPPGIRPSSPLDDVVKLAQAGVDPGVMLTYITNSIGTFNLGSGEIIYLNDLGLPNDLITAMIQRDQALKGASANASTPPAQPPPATGSDSAPPPLAPDAGAMDAMSQQNPPADYGDFYESLSPYGSWVDIAGYGTCWQPTVVVLDSGWQPYCHRGHWVLTDCGWYWMSDYSWGWATFHYGRWLFDPKWGWCWWPDSLWAPAWVCWRSSNEYCGWAPLPPAVGFQAGAGLTFRGAPIGLNADIGIRPDNWTFVRWSHFNDSRLNTHRLRRQDAAQVINSTAVFNNIVQGNNGALVNRGFPADRVRALSQKNIRPVQLREAIAGSRDLKSDQVDRDGRGLVIRRLNNAPSAPAAPGAEQGRAWIPRSQNFQRNVQNQNQNWNPAPEQRPGVNYNPPQRGNYEGPPMQNGPRQWRPEPGVPQPPRPPMQEIRPAQPPPQQSPPPPASSAGQATRNTTGKGQ